MDSEKGKPGSLVGDIIHALKDAGMLFFLSARDLILLPKMTGKLNLLVRGRPCFDSFSF